MLTFDGVAWDDEDDPDGNVQHIVRHGLTPDEVEDVLNGPAITHGFSRSSNRPCVWGRTATDKHIIVVYEETVQDGFTFIYPVTAYEVDV